MEHGNWAAKLHLYSCKNSMCSYFCQTRRDFAQRLISNFFSCVCPGHVSHVSAATLSHTCTHTDTGAGAWSPGAGRGSSSLTDYMLVLSLLVSEWEMTRGSVTGPGLSPASEPESAHDIQTPSRQYWDVSWRQTLMLSYFMINATIQSMSIPAVTSRMIIELSFIILTKALQFFLGI